MTLVSAFGVCPLCSWPDYDHRTGCPNDQPPRSIMDQIIEQVSAKVHENWMASKRAAGVESRKLESGEELMVPSAPARASTSTPRSTSCAWEVA